MGAAIKFKRAAATLRGIHSHDGFLGEETLLRFVQGDAFHESSNSLINDRMRSFRDSFREFSQRAEKTLKKGNSKSLQALLEQWIVTTIGYLQYDQFIPKSIPHWEEGQIFFLASPNDSHSVALFFCSSAESLTADFYSTLPLTNLKGDSLAGASRKESLCEQVEKAMKIAGVAEALLVLPNSLCYFRADSQISGQCLEVKWDEQLLDDADQALALSTYLLRSAFFSFQSKGGEEAAPQQEDGESEEGADEEVGDDSGVKLTQSTELFRENLEQARQITEELHRQVVLALEILVNERLAVDPALKKEAMLAKRNETIAYDLFKDGLFVLYRILFTLYAEAREFLPIHNKQFSSFYSMEHLKDWSEEFLKNSSRGTANPEGTYLWGTLNSIFTLLRRGVALPGGEAVSSYNGQLFAPDRARYFDQTPPLRDAAIARVLTALTRVGGDSSARRLQFSNLGVEQLGAVYEALLAQKPLIVREKSSWVPAHGGGVGLVVQSMIDALDMESFSSERQEGRARRRQGTQDLLEKYVDKRRPGFNPTTGTFVVAPLGGKKRQTASFYTPPKLAEFLVRRTLRPLAEGKSSKEILSIRTIEPAMGSGGFVIQVVRYLANQLLQAKIREKNIELRSGEKPSQKDLQRCKREVVENCIFGIDINPLAIELARTGLYLEALVPGEPLPFLHHRLKAGNSLIGADFQNQSNVFWEEGISFPMIFDIPWEHIKVEDKLLEAWSEIKGERSSEKAKTQFQAMKSRLKQERNQIPAESWASWANESQHKVSEFLQLSRKAQEDFEKTQSSNETVDALDDRYKDFLSFVPDMDPVLIEAYGAEVDQKLLDKRKRALLTELGVIGYRRLVQRQRAFTRLKALGDLHTALWYWPVDNFEYYPGYTEYKELCNWLLNEKTLEPKPHRTQLTTKSLSALRVALRVAKSVSAFHWQLEFAPVFADINKMGFDSLISNPPWKVVGIKDKEVFPEIDPQFMSTKPAEKAKRLAKLKEFTPAASQNWYDRLKFTIDFGNHWRNGHLSPIRPDGQLDLASLFTMKAELCTKDLGRIGLIVSRAAVLVNSGTKNIRERFFAEWGLEESCSFINLLGIFEIDSRVEFSLIIGGKGKKGLPAPRFVHKLVDPNSLDVVAKNLSAQKVSQIKVAPFPVEITLPTIRRYFSKESLSIPGLTDPKQLDLVKAFHGSTDARVTLEELDAFIRRGFDQKNGPKQGVSQLAEKISKSDLPKQSAIFANSLEKWVPMYRGRQFFLFDPMVADSSESSTEFYQYAKASEVEALGADLAKPSLMWRSISQPHNQRSFICSVVPPGYWSDHNVWMAQFNNFEHAIAVQSLLGSLAADFLIKIAGIGYMSLTVVSTIPLPTYTSNALTEACTLTRKLIAKEFSRSKTWSKLVPEKAVVDSSERLKTQAKVDALVWLHYGMGAEPLDRPHLEWMLDTQFDCLARHLPQYKGLVLSAFDEYSAQSRFKSGPTGTLFKKKVVELPKSQAPVSRKEKQKRA